MFTVHLLEMKIGRDEKPSWWSDSCGTGNTGDESRKWELSWVEGGGGGGMLGQPALVIYILSLGQEAEHRRNNYRAVHVFSNSLNVVFLQFSWLQMQSLTHFAPKPWNTSWFLPCVQLRLNEGGRFMVLVLAKPCTSFPRSHEICLSLVVLCSALYPGEISRPREKL
jgi:hypothetical protein